MGVPENAKNIPFGIANLIASALNLHWVLWPLSVKAMTFYHDSITMTLKFNCDKDAISKCGPIPVLRAESGSP
jgi:hypothetical protein